jgi:hypothetical protein
MRLRRPSPALVLAALALLAALSGTGYAAIVLPKDSVGPIQLRAGSVTSPEVRDGSLRAVDFAPPARLVLKGAKGDKGDPGTAGLSGLEIVGASSTFDSSKSKTIVVRCPAGKRLVGGGAGAWGRAMIFVPDGIALTASHPYDETGWLAAAHEVVPTEQDWFLRANAVCAAVP